MSKTIAIVKIGTDLMIGNSDIWTSDIQQYEPLCFAQHLVDLGWTVALHNETFYKQSSIQPEQANSIVVCNARELTDIDVLIVWQGVQILGGKPGPKMLQSYQATKQLQEQNPSAKQYFLLTDTRLPFIDMHSIDSSFPAIDISCMTLLTQASKHSLLLEDMREQKLTELPYQKWLPAPYYLQFADSAFLPLHLIAVDAQAKPPESENYKIDYDLLYTTQGLHLMGSKRLREWLAVFRSVKLHSNLRAFCLGKFRPIDHQLLNKHCPRGPWPHMLGLRKWIDVDTVINKSCLNLCLTEEKYAQYGLTPNRVIETIAAGAIPVLAPDIDCSLVVPSSPELTSLLALLQLGKLSIHWPDEIIETFEQLDIRGDSDTRYNFAVKLQTALQASAKQYLHSSLINVFVGQ